MVAEEWENERVEQLKGMRLEWEQELFRNRLKNLREEKKMTLRELGELTGFSKGYLSDLEQGRKRAPNDETVVRLQKALGIVGEESSLRDQAKEERREYKSARRAIKKSWRIASLADELGELDEEDLDEIFQGIYQVMAWTKTEEVDEPTTTS